MNNISSINRYLSIKNYDYDKETQKLHVTFCDFYENFCGREVLYEYTEIITGKPSIGKCFFDAIKNDDVPKAYRIRASVTENILSDIHLDGIETSDSKKNMALSISDPDKLRELSFDKNKNVRYAVSRNRHTPQDVLIRLAKDIDYNTRIESELQLRRRKH